MKPNEIHEIHWSLEQIENHIAEIHAFLRSDPNYRPMARRKFQGRKKMSRRKVQTSTSDKDWNNGGCQSKRRRKPKRDKGKRLPKVEVIYPSDDANDQIGREYAPIPVGDKWVHAGCAVFVPRKIYRHFERVRKALSYRMEVLSQAEPFEEW